MQIAASLLPAAAMIVIACNCCAQVAAPSPTPRPQLTITVSDENGVAVPRARAQIQGPGQANSLWCETDFTGRCQLQNLIPGSYELWVEKSGFYRAVQTGVQVGQTSDLDITLIHVREVREVVDVVESPPAIDPAQTASQEQLTGVDVINIPYNTTRDYRNVLNYIPSVVNDVNGQPHLAGAETYQTLTILDGFNVTQPANGQLLIRVSTDAFRSINVETSRYSPEYGKGSGGVVDLNTSSGDDHFRFLATDFTPSLQDRRGITLDKLTPRLTLSGPVKKGKIWFFDAADGEYDNIIFTELPPGQDSDIFWRVGNLVKVQANLSSRNILTTSFNYNLSHDQHAGFSPINPQSATPILDEPVYQASVKDQHYFAGGELLEAGFGFNRYDLDENPRGVEPYFISPETTGGNYYLAARTTADRWQAMSNLYLAPKQWHGRHDLKVGIDLDRLAYDASYLRQPISFLNEGQSLPSAGSCLLLTPSPCSRYSIFPGTPALQEHNLEMGGYALDRWSLTNRFLVEYGVRQDWDEIVRHPAFSPRVASTYVLDNSGNTKLSAGLGIFHDGTPLFLIARPYAGERVDYFFNAGGIPVAGPATARFSVNRGALEVPRFVNWSLGLERKLPWQIYLKAEFVQKRGTGGFAYNTVGGVAPNTSGVSDFLLQNRREDHYDSFQVNLRRSFEKGHMVMLSYTRSRSTSNQVLDFNVDNPIFSAQVPGPYPWDAPNRFLAWGFLPLIKGFDLGYSTELRSGFPFYVVNDQQELAPLAGHAFPAFLRFPTFFTLNLHVEKRFSFLGYNLAIRGGFDNLTDRKNYGFVNNDINSPQFLTFTGFEGRGFTTRIRFLGRK